MFSVQNHAIIPTFLKFAFFSIINIQFIIMIFVDDRKSQKS